MALAPVFLLSLALHALIGWRVAPDLASFHGALGNALWMVLALSATLMPMGLLARRVAKPPLSNVLTWMGLLCMGLFSSLLVLTVLREVLLAVAQGTEWLWPGLKALVTLRTDTALALPVLALLVTTLGFWNARRTAAVVNVDVPITNLPEALHGFTVVQISDIHIGPTIKTQYLQRIVDKVNSLNANLVAITGDLVDGSVKDLGHHIAPLSQLASTHGTFFVTGNHEYYSGAHSWIDALRALGVQVLMNEHVLVHHSIDDQDPETALVVVAGVTDFSAHHFDESHRSDPHKAMANAPDHAVFKMLLAHQPSGIDRPTTHAICSGDIQSCNTRKASQAHSVPAVPGASGLSPAPNPSAMQCAGCASMKAGVGRTGPGIASLMRELWCSAESLTLPGYGRAGAGMLVALGKIQTIKEATYVEKSNRERVVSTGVLRQCQCQHGAGEPDRHHPHRRTGTGTLREVPYRGKNTAVDQSEAAGNPQSQGR